MSDLVKRILAKTKGEGKKTTLKKTTKKEIKKSKKKQASKKRKEEKREPTIDQDDFRYDECLTQKIKLNKNARKIEVIGYGGIEGRKAITTLVKITDYSIILRFDKTGIDEIFPKKNGMARTSGDLAGWIIPEDIWNELK